jgi:hypothetical protein
VRVDGGWRVTGQKVWTTAAHQSDWGFATVRTDPTAEKHAGVTMMAGPHESIVSVNAQPSDYIRRTMSNVQSVDINGITGTLGSFGTFEFDVYWSVSPDTVLNVLPDPQQTRSC